MKDWIEVTAPYRTALICTQSIISITIHGEGGNWVSCIAGSHEIFLEYPTREEAQTTYDLLKGAIT